MTTLRWNRSEDGFTDSKCGRYSIEAYFIGRTTPQGYAVYCNDESPPRKINRYCPTQRDAKRVAQRDADKTEETNQ